MKKIIVSLAIIVTATLAANAQQTDQPMQHRQPGQFGHRGGHSMHRGEGMAGVHFSDQQRQQLKTINTDFRKKITDLKKNEDITVREFKSRMGALQKEHRAQMQALLTPAQKDQIAKMKQQRIEMAKVNANARMEKMKIKLGLSDTQAGQLKNMHTDMAAKMKSIHTDNSLSQEQKREQMKALVVQQKDQLKTILTPEQLQQMQQMRKGQHMGEGQHRGRDFSK